MLTRLLTRGGFVSLIGGGLDHRRPLVAKPLIDLGRRYAVAREGADADALLQIGRDLYVWLDGKERWLAELLPKLAPPFLLEIEAPLQPSAPDWAVLQAPWELLANQAGFLAADAQLRYAPARRLGERAKQSPALDDYRLGVAFMAASPFGAHPLDFEAEEAAIMAASGRELDLLVEESGDPEELGRRMAKLEQSLPVLHLSCHGHNAWCGWDGTEDPRPVLMLEDAATGEARPTTASNLGNALGAFWPRMLFLSVRMTDAAGETTAGSRAVSDPLSSLLVAHVPAVLGWEGSVGDAAATALARELYDNLGKKLAMPLAAANARRALLEGRDNSGGTGDPKREEPAAQLEQRLRAEREALQRDWHLARVWLGPEGGGPVVGGDFERSLIPPGGAPKRRLTENQGERLEVADASVFVGRRRELKQALRILAGREKAAILLHSIGWLGKSSLAGRIIDRRPDLTSVVVFAAYDAMSVVEALAKALEDHEPAAKLIAERRPQVRDDPAALRPLLVKLLSGPCKWRNDGGKPLLLLVDKLERALESDPAGGRHRVRSEVRPVLSALLHAFTPQRGNSRLLLTSRFPFTLVEDGCDLTKGLAELDLSDFSETSRRKLALRQIKVAQAAQENGPGLDEATLMRRLPLLAQAQEVARGNPGLQDLLGSDFVLRPAVPPERAKAVLEEMQTYLNRGTLPSTEELSSFLNDLKIDSLLAQAGPTNTDLLRAMTLFSAPVPESVPQAAFASRGGEARRLRDLGLLTPAEDLIAAGRTALTVSGLAAGRLAPLVEAERTHLSRLALPTLFTAWGGARGQALRPYSADIELTRLSFIAHDIEILKTCAVDAIAGHVASGQPHAAGKVGSQIIAILKDLGCPVPLRLMARTIAAWRAAGNEVAAMAILEEGVDNVRVDTEDLNQLSSFLLVQATLQVTPNSGAQNVPRLLGIGMKPTSYTNPPRAGSR